MRARRDRRRDAVRAAAIRDAVRADQTSAASRPKAFDQYSASSARRRSVSASRAVARSQMPIEAVTSRPPANGAERKEACSRWAAISAAAAASSGSSQANSSPPIRPTVSTARAAPAMRAAASASTRSPVGCPWTSLTALKWSRSTTISDSGRPSSSARAASAASRSRNARWLSRPVRPSWLARWASTDGASASRTVTTEPIAHGATVTNRRRPCTWTSREPPPLPVGGTIASHPHRRQRG